MRKTHLPARQENRYPRIISRGTSQQVGFVPPDGKPISWTPYKTGGVIQHCFSSLHPAKQQIRGNQVIDCSVSSHQRTIHTGRCYGSFTSAEKITLPYPIQLGAEKVLNHDFSQWTVPNYPDDWTVENEDATNYFSEHAEGCLVTADRTTGPYLGFAVSFPAVNGETFYYEVAKNGAYHNSFSFYANFTGPFNFTSDFSASSNGDILNYYSAKTILNLPVISYLDENNTVHRTVATVGGDFNLSPGGEYIQLQYLSWSTTAMWNVKIWEFGYTPTDQECRAIVLQPEVWARYRCDEFAGLNIWDDSGNGRHGWIEGHTENTFFGNRQDEYSWLNQYGWRPTIETRFPSGQTTGIEMDSRREFSFRNEDDTADTPFTITCRARLTPKPPDVGQQPGVISSRTLVSKGDSFAAPGAVTEWEVYIDTNGNLKTFAIVLGNVASGNGILAKGNRHWYGAGDEISDTEVFHIAYTYDGKGVQPGDPSDIINVKIYLNGEDDTVFVIEFGAFEGLTITDEPLRFFPYSMNGELHEFHLYNRVLTQAEIQMDRDGFPASGLIESYTPGTYRNDVKINGDYVETFIPAVSPTHDLTGYPLHPEYAGRVPYNIELVAAPCVHLQDGAYIQPETNPFLSGWQAGKWTLAFWMRCETFGTVQDRVVLFSSTGLPVAVGKFPGAGQFTCTTNTNGSLLVQIRTDSLTTGTEVINYDTRAAYTLSGEDFLLDVNTDYHFMLTLDFENNDGGLYFGGERISNAIIGASYDPKDMTLGEPPCFGIQHNLVGSAFVNSRHMTGDFWDIRWFDGVACNEYDQRELMAGRIIYPEKCRLHWWCNEGYDHILADATGNEQHGYLKSYTESLLWINTQNTCFAFAQYGGTYSERTPSPMIYTAGYDGEIAPCMRMLEQYPTFSGGGFTVFHNGFLYVFDPYEIRKIDLSAGTYVDIAPPDLFTFPFIDNGQLYVFDDQDLYEVMSNDTLRHILAFPAGLQRIATHVQLTGGGVFYSFYGGAYGAGFAMIKDESNTILKSGDPDVYFHYMPAELDGFIYLIEVDIATFTNKPIKCELATGVVSDDPDGPYASAETFNFYTGAGMLFRVTTPFDWKTESIGGPFPDITLESWNPETNTWRENFDTRYGDYYELFPIVDSSSLYVSKRVHTIFSVYKDNVCIGNFAAGRYGHPRIIEYDGALYLNGPDGVLLRYSGAGTIWEKVGEASVFYPEDMIEFNGRLFLTAFNPKVFQYDGNELTLSFDGGGTGSYQNQFVVYSGDLYFITGKLEKGYKYDPGSGTWSEEFTAPYNIRFACEYSGKLFFACEDSKLYSWDGAVVTEEVTLSDDPWCCAVWNGEIYFGAGWSPSSLYSWNGSVETHHFSIPEGTGAIDRVSVIDGMLYLSSEEEYRWASLYTWDGVVLRKQGNTELWATPGYVTKIGDAIYNVAIRKTTGFFKLRGSTSTLLGHHPNFWKARSIGGIPGQFHMFALTPEGVGFVTREQAEYVASMPMRVNDPAWYWHHYKTGAVKQFPAPELLKSPTAADWFVGGVPIEVDLTTILQNNADSQFLNTTDSKKIADLVQVSAALSGDDLDKMLALIGA